MFHLIQSNSLKLIYSILKMCHFLIFCKIIPSSQLRNDSLTIWMKFIFQGWFKKFYLYRISSIWIIQKSLSLGGTLLNRSKCKHEIFLKLFGYDSVRFQAKICNASPMLHMGKFFPKFIVKRFFNILRIKHENLSLNPFSSGNIWIYKLLMQLVNL